MFHNQEKHMHAKVGCSCTLLLKVTEKSVNFVKIFVDTTTHDNQQVKPKAFQQTSRAGMGLGDTFQGGGRLQLPSQGDKIRKSEHFPGNPKCGRKRHSKEQECERSPLCAAQHASDKV